MGIQTLAQFLRIKVPHFTSLLEEGGNIQNAFSVMVLRQPCLMGGGKGKESPLKANTRVWFLRRGKQGGDMQSLSPGSSLP